MALRVILCLNVSLIPHPLHLTTGLLEIEILLNQLHAARRQNILLLIQNNYFSFALSFILKLSLRGLDTPGPEYSVISCLRCLRPFYRPQLQTGKWQKTLEEARPLFDI